MATESFSVSSIIPASPERIYDAWLDGTGHSAFTGGAATVEPGVGGKFTAWDGYIHGTTLELDPGRRILQSWGAEDFPAGAGESRLEVLLEEVEGGTRVTINHSEVPEGHSEALKEGWSAYYFEPMKRHFAPSSPAGAPSPSPSGERSLVATEELDILDGGDEPSFDPAALAITDAPQEKGRSARAAVKKPVVKKPAVTKPAAKKPVVKAAAKKPSAAEKPRVVKKSSAVKKPAARRPAAARPADKKASGGKPVAKKPVAKKPTAKKPVAKKPVAKKPTARKPPVRKPVAKKPTARKPVARKPAAKKPTAKKPAVKKTGSARAAATKKAPVKKHAARQPVAKKGKPIPAKRGKR